jgi:hypothetical protein
MNEAEQQELEELQNPGTWDWENAMLVTEPSRGGAVVAVQFEGEEQIVHLVEARRQQSNADGTDTLDAIEQTARAALQQATGR